MLSKYLRSSHRNQTVSQKRDRILPAVLFCFIALSALSYRLIVATKSKEPPPVQIASQLSSDSDQIPAEAPQTLARTETYTIQSSDTLGSVLPRFGMTEEQSRSVIESLRDVFSPRGIRPGHSMSLTFDPDGNLTNLRYTASPIEIYEIERGDNGYAAKHVDVPIETVQQRVQVSLKSSLYESLIAAGESPSLISELVDILAWDIDFFSDPREGDTFTVLVNKDYVDGEFYRYGRVLAVDYDGAAVKQKAFYFKPADGYFDEKGLSLARNFLKTPVKYSRISSKFGRRVHPITHSLHKHLGTDFVAPTGTPVWAMSDGRVAKMTRDPYSGNYISIKHSNRYETSYLHLSKFNRALKVGHRVRQKDVIGYVGTTGRSTGPHLHLSVKYAGKHIDPLTLKRVKEATLSREQLAVFEQLLPSYLSMLAGSDQIESPSDSQSSTKGNGVI